MYTLGVMLPKKKRLSREAFNTIFTKGHRSHSPFLQIITSKTDTFHGSVVVGKKVYQKAVDRNKLRRQLYALLYHFSKQAPTPCTYIVIAKPAIKGVSFLELKESFLKQLESLAKR
jgi:ribonuclease P protein component